MLGCNKKANIVWKGMWVAIVRKIWIHRNRIVFKNGIVDCEKIFYLALIKGWSWVKFRTRGILFLMSNWYMHPGSCLKYIV